MDKDPEEPKPQEASITGAFEACFAPTDPLNDSLLHLYVCTRCYAVVQAKHMNDHHAWHHHQAWGRTR